ncbi:hemin ABC transporter substrate-binding protein [Luteibacter aegosomaticola]|uniref:heme/hemin ABC transporter substrate-binding protein n=1 Tax=Luteibacter aegosomaticola TaxID=2911538 RepID=UPI001FF84A16|nr:hemin ABC transporter substrate-binding protein [Luteibacter aegosomaticola]UPG90592.1 hemin ABC transporter substrate-binding protein [Luteibacter aegosomaticola]
MSARRLLLAAAFVALPCVAAVATAATRVVSLGGDVTEIVYAIHAQDELAARDSTSTWPEAAKALPDVGYVRQLSAEGVLALRPDLILATHDAGPPTAIEQIRSAGVRIETLPASRTPEDIEAKIRRIGELTAHTKDADALATDVATRFNALAKAVAAMPHHPRVVFLMSTGQGSPMAAGHDTAADRAIALAGGVNAVADVPGYKAVSPEALVAMKPDVILLMKEREDAVGGVAGVLAMPGVGDTPAGKSKRIDFVEGQALLGFGPRTAENAAALQARWARP